MKTIKFADPEEIVDLKVLSILTLGMIVCFIAICCIFEGCESSVSQPTSTPEYTQQQQTVTECKQAGVGCYQSADCCTGYYCAQEDTGGGYISNYCEKFNQNQKFCNNGKCDSSSQSTTTIPVKCLKSTEHQFICCIDCIGF